VGVDGALTATGVVEGDGPRPPGAGVPATATTGGPAGPTDGGASDDGTGSVAAGAADGLGVGATTTGDDGAGELTATGGTLPEGTGDAPAASGPRETDPAIPKAMAARTRFTAPSASTKRRR
jgi:hypothetical protein